MGAVAMRLDSQAVREARPWLARAGRVEPPWSARAGRVEPPEHVRRLSSAPSRDSDLAQPSGHASMLALHRGQQTLRRYGFDR